MSDTRVIKRYANRKLYDTQHSRYVTLDQIAEMIRTGDDVKIIDNKSKEDLTSITLAQIIFEEEKKQKSFLPLQAMRNIIQTGGESITQLVTQAQKKVTHILKRDEGAESDDPAVAEAAELEQLDAGEDDPAGASRRGLRELREWLDTTQRSIDEWQRKVDGRIRDVVGGISPFTGIQKDVSLLASRLSELEAKLTKLFHDSKDDE
jgi:polyhydroxyalkanoate synthesis repressor PhaR